MKAELLALCLMILSSSICGNDTQEINMDIDDEENKAYMAQSHRFAIKGCELTYNEKPFFIGMSIDEARAIFGKETKTYDFPNRIKPADGYYWEDFGLELVTADNIVNHIYTYLKNISNKQYAGANIVGNISILYNNTVLKQTDKMHEFVNKAAMSFDDMELSRFGYKIITACGDKRIINYFNSPLAYHRKGFGHLYVRGDWKLENTNEVDYIHIYYKDDKTEKGE